jgi:hypothetical protein
MIKVTGSGTMKAVTLKDGISMIELDFQKSKVTYVAKRQGRVAPVEAIVISPE